MAFMAPGGPHPGRPGHPGRPDALAAPPRREPSAPGCAGAGSAAAHRRWLTAPLASKRLEEWESMEPETIYSPPSRIYNVKYWLIMIFPFYNINIEHY